MNWREIRKNYTWARVKSFIRKDVIESKDSNRRIVFSIMTGSFIGLLPFWGIQSVLAILMAMRMKLSKIITFAFSTISIPFLPLVLFGGYATGALVLGQPLVFSMMEMDKSMLLSILVPYLIGSLILAAIVSTLLGMIFGVILHYARR